MQIRAITTFLRTADKEKILQHRDILLSIKFPTLSKRISLPPVGSSSLDKLSDVIPSGDEILYSLGGLRWNDPRIRNIRDILKSGKNFFIHVLLDDERGIEEVIKLLDMLEPEESTRFAVLIDHEYLTTPYFPTSSSTLPIESIGLSLLYVKDFQKGKGLNALLEAKKIGVSIQESIGIKFAGIDPSLSPWMDESIGEFLESLSNSRLFTMGVLHKIREINQKIEEYSFSAGLEPLGFSEVMLPVAEDNVLRERALEGRLTLTHLAYMSTVCAAGIDMVGVIYDRETYTNIFRDAMSIQKIKRRPYAIRIIPSRGEEKIYTPLFGFIPVVKVV
jgi:uncharacterized protein (UPF0210 family)